MHAKHAIHEKSANSDQRLLQHYLKMALAALRLVFEYLLNSLLLESGQAILRLKLQQQGLHQQLAYLPFLA